MEDQKQIYNFNFAFIELQRILRFIDLCIPYSISMFVFIYLFIYLTSMLCISNGLSTKPLIHNSKTKTNSHEKKSINKD